MMLTNQSRLVEDERCPRRYFFRYMRGLETMYPSVHAHRGDAVHLALRRFYAGGTPEEAVATYLQRMGEFAQQGDPLLLKEVPLWKGVLEGYFQHWAGDTFEVLKAPEAELTAKLGRHSIGARLDLIIRRADGTVWVMDHKTVSRTGSSFWSQFFVDKQGSTYCYIAQEALGLPVAGWIINALKPTKEDRYERNAFMRTQRQIDSWKRQEEAHLDALEQRRALTGDAGVDDLERIDIHFPQRTVECHTVYGTCPFLAVCQTGAAALPVFARRAGDYIDEQQ